MTAKQGGINVIQIDFFDKDVVGTLVPIFSLNPDKIYFFTDRREMVGMDIKYMTNAIKRRLPNTFVDFISVDIDDMDDIYGKLTTIAKKDQDEIAYVDLTGGTELMSICGYRVSEEFGFTPIYLDTKRRRLNNAITGELVAEAVSIDLTDFFNAIGAKQLSPSHDMPKEEEFDRILSMSEILFDDVEAWQVLYQHLSTAAKTANQKLQVRVRPNGKLGTNAVRRIMREFEAHGFWEAEDDDIYRYGNIRYMHYMTTFGIWLEMYIYIKALDFFDEAALGVVVDWRAADDLDTEDNEIDVLGIKRSVPVLISCKMRKLASGDLYEAGYIAKRLSESGTKSVIATTYPVKEEGSQPKRMYQRMKKLRIGLIETRSFKEKTPAEIFNQAMQMGEDF